LLEAGRGQSELFPMGRRGRYPVAVLHRTTGACKQFGSTILLL